MLPQALPSRGSGLLAHSAVNALAQKVGVAVVPGGLVARRQFGLPGTAKA
jgi:hypothetical protein